MLNYTRASINIIIDDIKKYYKIFKYGSLIFTTAYFVYALIAQIGNVAANIILASLYVAYTAFEIITRNKNLRQARRIVRRSYHFAKIGINALTLGIMLYGIYTATTNVKPISIILATLMIILWVLQLLLAIIVEVVESKAHLVAAGWSKDMQDLKPKNIIGGIFKRNRDEDETEDTLKSRELEILERRVKQDREARKEKRRKRGKQVSIEYEEEYDI